MFSGAAMTRGQVERVEPRARSGTTAGCRSSARTAMSILSRCAEEQLAVVAGRCTSPGSSSPRCRGPCRTARPCSSEVSEEKTRWRGSMPSASKKPIQNWCVDQRLRTRGMPIRSSARDGAARRGRGGRRPSRTISATLGYARLTSSSFAFTTRISLASSTQSLRAGVAADHALPARRRAAPCSTAGPAARAARTSMKVRVQLTGHHLQTVSLVGGARVRRAPRSRRSRGSGSARRRSRQSPAHSAAPMAPGLAGVRMHHDLGVRAPCRG